MISSMCCALCVAVLGVEAACVGHAAGDSGYGGGVLGSGAHSAQQPGSSKRISGPCRVYSYPVPR